MSDGLLNAGGQVSSYALASPVIKQKQVDREQEGFVGPVRKIWLKVSRSARLAGLIPIQRRVPLRIIFFNELGDKTKVVSYDPASSNKKQTEIYLYDLAGRKIETTLTQRSLVVKTIYRYFDAENMIERLEQINDGGRRVTRKYTSIFDGRGNQIKASYQEDSISEINVSYDYEFDNNGQVRKIETYGGAQVPSHKIIFDYDSAGKLNRKSSYHSQGYEYGRRTFTYGPNGYSEEKLSFDAAATVKRKVVYRFDERNNLIDVAGYDASESPIGRTSHALQYDDVGNWVQKVSQSWDVVTGNPTSQWIEYQVISYG